MRALETSAAAHQSRAASACRVQLSILDNMRTQSSRHLDSLDTYLYVPNSFQVKPGARINADLFVGRGLGVGLQVRLLGWLNLEAVSLA